MLGKLFERRRSVVQMPEIFRAPRNRLHAAIQAASQPEQQKNHLKKQQHQKLIAMYRIVVVIRRRSYYTITGCRGSYNPDQRGWYE